MSKPYLKYFAGLLLFGSNGVVASFIGLNSYEIVLLRSVLGCVLLTGLLFLSGHRLTATHNKKICVSLRCPEWRWQRTGCFSLKPTHKSESALGC